jgi:AraC-like DNA-binding protein
MQTAANLGQALRIFNQYFDVAGPIARQLLQIDGKTAHWQSLDVIPVEPARRIGVEEMLGGNFNLCKQLTGGKFKLKALYLDYPAPEGAEHYEELFQCPILFEQDIIKMEFDASLLNLKMKNADPESQRVCEQRCQELLKGLKSSVDLVDQIRRIIYENPCDRRDEYSVASILCMSTRTLRRQLKSANTSFRQVLSEVLKALAFDYLNQTSLSIDEISFLLGYSDTSSFRHAFKQWTGETPTTYRNQLM